MTKAQKAKWIEALRSGKFKQGREWLFGQGRYCCLGVAGVAVFGKKREEIRYAEMPQQCDYRVAPKDVEDALAELNDGIIAGFDVLNPVPFEVIAGVIDQWVETDD